MSGFKTKARAIDLLGEKQIKDEATAISELFKNAHDADATNVELSIDTKARALVLWDNGHGMSLEDVETRWLTVGTDSKLSTSGAPKRSQRGRVMMGEKGIGRLAVATLGAQTLMITKTSNGPYVLAYLHWDVFTNGELFLEDTVVPVRTSADLSNVEHILRELKQEQIRNIESSNERVAKAWAGQYSDLGLRILRDIDQLALDELLLLPALDKIQSQGTMFYVTNLKEKWEVLADPAQRGQRLKRKRESLSIMMSSFINTIELFEGHNQAANELYAFSPRMLVDGRDLVSAVRFEEEDLNRYDYGLTGEIRGGKFVGQHLVHDKDPEQTTVDLSEELDVDDLVDCGPFHVSIFFVEGEPRNTLLDPAEHAAITDKLDHIGGIYVYRDGLRVLPYGTPEHDFLEIEKRRTLKAGRYVFSMRNLFGYVAISKEANPGLQDKSSREGIRETPEYDYFRSVLIRLMVWWGKDFLNAKGRREEERERKRRERELQEMEKRRQADRQRFIEALTAADLERRDAVGRQVGELQGQVNKLVPTPHELSSEMSLVLDYNQLWAYLETLDNTRRSLAQQVSAIGSAADLPYRPQYATDGEVKRIRESYVAFIQEQQQQLSTHLSARCSAAREYVQGELYAYLDRVAEEIGTPYAETFVSGLQSAVQHAGTAVEAAAEQAVASLQRSVAEKATVYRDTLAEWNTLVSKGEKVAEEDGIKAILEPLELVKSEVSVARELLQQFTRLDRSSDLKGMASEIQQRTARVGDLMAEAEEGVATRLQSVLDRFSVSALDVLGKTGDATLVQEDRRYLALLEELVKEQQEELAAQRGLAITGTAAEVLNHEFEMTYGLIRNLLEKSAIRAAFDVTPDLRTVYDLLTHVQELYRRVKPMYRKARMYRRVLSLYEVVDQVQSLFASILSSNRVTLLNRVDKNFSVYESEPVLFPVLVNLFNNAVHWMMTKEERTILVRTDLTRGALYIEDSGVGVAPENADRLFDLFYTTRVEGRGIGLHLVHKLLADRKHTVTCVTDEPEKVLDGACFRIDFESSTVRVG